MDPNGKNLGYCSQNASKVTISDALKMSIKALQGGDVDVRLFKLWLFSSPPLLTDSTTGSLPVNICHDKKYSVFI